MATQVQFRKGTQSEIDAFTGANAEIVVNTSNNSVVVQNGSTAGGFEAMRADLANANAGSAALTTGSLTTGALTAAATTVTTLTASSTGQILRLGLGASPHASYSLDTAGEIRVNSNIRITEATSSTESGSINLSDAGLLQIQSFATGGEIAFDTGPAATEALRLDASQNATFYGTVTTDVSEGAANSLNTQISMTHRSGSTGYHLKTIRSASSDEPDGLAFVENTTERMRIRGGNVGIGLGANSANALLHVGDGTDVTVGDATNPAIQIGSDTGYRLGMYTDAEGGYIENKNGDDGIRFRVKTAGEVMRIATSGNVLINSAGATSPDPLKPFQVILHSGGGRRFTSYYNADTRVSIASLNASNTWENFDIEGAEVRIKTGGTTQASAITVDSNQKTTFEGEVHIYDESNQGLLVESTDAYSGIEIKDSTSNALPPLVSALGNDMLFYGYGGSSRDLRFRLTSSEATIYSPVGNSQVAALDMYATNGSAYGGSSIARVRVGSVTDGTAYGSKMRLYTTDTSNNLIEAVVIDSSQKATFEGGVTVNAGNGDQLTLNNAGERFTQITLKENGSTQGGLWLDGTDNYVDLYANTSHGIRLKTGGDNAAVTVTDDQNVGIGTDPGLTRFNVLHDVANWTAIFKNTAANAYGLSIDLGNASGAGGQADIFALAVYTPVNTGFFVLKGGNVGIGRSDPYDTFVISRASTDQLEGVVLENTQAGGYGTGITWESQRSDVASTQTAGRIYVAGEQNWGSDAYASSAMYFQLRSANSVGTRLAISAAGTFTGSASNDISDRRLKENIETITDPLTKVKALTGRTFNWKKESGQASGVKYGFIAQEVESVISDLVHDKSGIIKIKPDNSINQAPMPEDEGEYAKSVQSTGIIPILVEAIKELSAKIEALENN